MRIQCRLECGADRQAYIFPGFCTNFLGLCTKPQDFRHKKGPMPKHRACCYFYLAKALGFLSLGCGVLFLQPVDVRERNAVLCLYLVVRNDPIVNGLVADASVRREHGTDERH